MDRRLGLTIPLQSYDLRESCEIARKAEQLGYTDVWTAEVSGPDGLAAATAVGIATETVRIGCAIAPAFSRPPALTAMGALAAQQASGGRFCLGLGPSTPTIVEGWMGVPYQRPVVRIRETIEVVRAALAGEKVSFDGSTVRSHGFRLEQPAPTEVPIYLAALGPKMMQLASEVADGIALFFTAEAGVRLAREAAPDLDLVARIMCCPNEPVEDIRNFARWFLAPYVAAEGYNRFVARQGFEDEAAAVGAAWRSGDRDAAREAMSDRLIDAVVLTGPAERCKERIEELRAAGLGTPILMLMSFQGGREGLARAVEDMAP